MYAQSYMYISYSEILHFAFFKNGRQFVEAVPNILVGGWVDHIFKLAVVVVVGSLLGLCQAGVHWVT